MPQTLSYPGVYIDELPSPVHTIIPVPTSVLALAGRALRGPLDTPVVIHSESDFIATFGPLWTQSELGQCVEQYYANGGSDAVIVRVFDKAGHNTFVASPPGIAIPTTGGGTLTVYANSPGTWFSNVEIVIDYDTRKQPPPAVNTTYAGEFNLTVRVTETDPVRGTVQLPEEKFRNLTFDKTSPQYVCTVLAADSKFIVAGSGGLAAGDTPVNNASAPVGYTYATNNAGGAPDDGLPLAWTDLVPGINVNSKHGIYALESADIFTMLVIPPLSPDEAAAPDRPLDTATWAAINAYCTARRAMAFVDPQSTWIDVQTALGALQAGTVDPLRFDNTVMYFPWIQVPDSLDGNRPRYFSPSAAVAGRWASIDFSRGIWKSPAGQEAPLLGVQQLLYKMNDSQNGDLNPLGINCLRNFPILGSVVWGARTLDGADAQTSQWKYVAVRRTAYFIEESLYRGTKWVVFEPNDEPLWSQIRLNVDSFMRSLFSQGAFQGATPKDAYFVRCDSNTTKQSDIDMGVVNILVGFAPLKPAEFVVIKISQIVAETVL